MYRPHMQLFILFLSFFAFSAILSPTAQAATMFTVTATADTVASDGSCTLREAVLAANGSSANADCGSDYGVPYTVNFYVNGTIALGSAFSNIQNLTVANGNAGLGGGILNNGVLNVANCTITGNSATGSGGAIFNYGTLEHKRTME